MILSLKNVIFVMISRKYLFKQMISHLSIKRINRIIVCLLDRLEKLDEKDSQDIQKEVSSTFCNALVKKKFCKGDLDWFYTSQALKDGTTKVNSIMRKTCT